MLLFIEYMSEREQDFEALAVAANTIGLSLDSNVRVHGSDELMSLGEAVKRCEAVGSIIMKFSAEYADNPEGHGMAKRMLGVVDDEPPIEIEHKSVYEDVSPEPADKPALMKESVDHKVSDLIKFYDADKLVQEPMFIPIATDKATIAEKMTSETTPKVTERTLAPQQEVSTPEPQTDLVSNLQAVEEALVNEILQPEEMSPEKDTEEKLAIIEAADTESFVLDTEVASAETEEPLQTAEQVETIAFEPEVKALESTLVPEQESIIHEVVDTIIAETMQELLPSEVAFEVEPESEAAVTAERITEVVESFIEISAEESVTLEVLETKLEELVEVLFQQLDITITPEQKRQLVQRFVKQAVELRSKQILSEQLEVGTSERRHAGMRLQQLSDDTERTGLVATFLGPILLKLKPAA